MKYTPSHEWAKIEQDKATIGISSYGQKELGNVVFVQLPQVGAKLQKGDEAAILESTKAAVDLYTPLTGEVIAVNESLQETPSLINSSPEEKGWLFILKVEHPQEEQELLTLDDYQNMLG